MNAVTFADAIEKLERSIEQVLGDAEPAIRCTEKGERVVLVSLDEFSSWKETIYLLGNPANAAHLRKSIAEAGAGNLNVEQATKKRMACRQEEDDDPLKHTK